MLMARRRRPRVGRHQFTTETKQNLLFETYYKGQCLMPESEWSNFIHALQQELPLSFRVTGFRAQNKELLRLLKHRYLAEISNLQIPPSNGDAGEGQHVSLQPLSWYPEELAWQLDASRFTVRKTNELKPLHQFLVSEMESGNISRQETVSMLPPLLMDIRSDHAILDLCAAPGSKSAQLVELLHADAESTKCCGDGWLYTEPEGVIVANDVDQKRCYMMIHQVKRLQSPCTLITQEDATCFPRLFVPVDDTAAGDKSPQVKLEQFLFDRILADVPCSGDGTLRKNPDLWLRWTPNLGIAEHYLQVRILRRGLELLRDPAPDGSAARLVYSTCSLNPLEDEAVVAHLLQACQGTVQLVDPARLKCISRIGSEESSSDKFKTRPGLTSWRVMNKKGCWFERFDQVPQGEQCNLRPSLFPPSNASDLHLDRCMRVLPHDQNTGGFFVAVLEKVAPLPWMKSRHYTIPADPNHSALSPATNLALDCNPSETSEVHLEKRTHDGSSATSDEPKKSRIFNENPFSYIDPASDPDWAGIRDYYGILEVSEDCTPSDQHHDRMFRPSNLLYRSTAEEVRRRQFYYTNDLVKKLIQWNVSRGVKIVNSGVRMFCLMVDKQFTGYRLLQDGVELADAFLPPIGGRRIRLTDAQYPDLVLLLEEEMPLIERMTAETRSQWTNLDTGPVLIEYTPGTQTDSKLPQCRLVFAGWRGVKSLRHYIGRHERLHLMRLAHLEPKPAVMGHGPRDLVNSTDPIQPTDQVDDLPSEPFC